ncbi:hypothetical protein [Streptomyces sp. enrichment culture]|uniref:hypothetical protein n=1 Tax=Streptomyces sp. enrichment culture TaxID=1795815 RepID=UPI003F576176
MDAAEAHLGLARLYRSGKDADPLIVLTACAVQRLGLPAVLEDRRGLRLSDDHPLLRQLAAEQWKLTKRCFGPWDLGGLSWVNDHPDGSE